MNTASKIILSLLVLLGASLIVRRAGFASAQPALPNDMPRGATFASSGFNLADNEPRGQWISCRVERTDASNWCRITDQAGIVVYEGTFLPAGRSTPASAGELKIVDFLPSKNWIQGPAEARPIPVIPLSNGLLLVPSADSEILGDRWAKNPQESAAFHPLPH